MENESVVIGNVEFVATLWTDFALLGDDRVDLAMHEAERRMNDYKTIRIDANRRRLRAPTHWRRTAKA
ncbi:hypothetical protein [Bradyrhizobium japonicum]|uniref:hypothetical protein n=1 Tax=Bradyrhizobium japonicum TaxID=375 RepID=UPI001BA6F8F5|nr:hypothetical protein [Bradyrhizobium japonicum]MBR0911489.1 hypothetical protein [Bradyrhizobium japonicum]